MIDSEQVPWGKGEKQSDKDSEIDLKPYAYKESERTYLYDPSWRAYWRMSQRVNVYCSAKSARMEP